MHRIKQVLKHSKDTYCGIKIKDSPKITDLTPFSSLKHENNLVEFLLDFS